MSTLVPSASDLRATGLAGPVHLQRLWPEIVAHVSVIHPCGSWGHRYDTAMFVALLLSCTPDPSAPTAISQPLPEVPQEPVASGPRLEDLPREGDPGADRSPAILFFQAVKDGCALVAHRAVSGAIQGLAGFSGACPTRDAGASVSADGSSALLWGQAPDGLWQADLKTGVATSLPIPPETTPLWMAYAPTGAITLFTAAKAALATADRVVSVTIAGKSYEVKDAPEPPGERVVAAWTREGDSEWQFAAIGEADTPADRFNRVPGQTLAPFKDLKERATPDRWVCPTGARAEAGLVRSLKGKESSKTGFWQEVPTDCPAAIWVDTSAAPACASTAAIWAKGQAGWSSRVSLAEGSRTAQVRGLGRRTLVIEERGARVVHLCGDEPERKYEGAYAGLWPVSLPLPGATPAATSPAPAAATSPPSGVTPPPSTAPAAAP